MKALDFGVLEKPETGTNVPSSVTLLVSLFLILITFFVIINQAPVKDPKKKEIAIQSMQKKFGKAEENAIQFGGLVKPKADSYAMEMEKLFGKNAQVVSTVNGDEISINASKEFFYFSDEVAFRSENMDLLVKLQNILLRWDKSSRLKITLILGAGDYEMDKKRLENFSRLMSRPGIDIGIDNINKDKFTINIKYQ